MKRIFFFDEKLLSMGKLIAVWFARMAMSLVIQFFNMTFVLLVLFVRVSSTLFLLWRRLDFFFLSSDLSEMLLRGSY